MAIGLEADQEVKTMVKLWRWRCHTQSTETRLVRIHTLTQAASIGMMVFEQQESSLVVVHWHLLDLKVMLTPAWTWLEIRQRASEHVA
jgi:hypothetical protein